MRRGRSVIASHLVFTGYGFWVPNDIRGSGSTELRDPRFEELGPIHLGRKRYQPTRDELREFYQSANELLTHELIWFDERLRNEIGAALGAAIKARGYTCWAGAVCSNHVHALIRIHRDDALTMWMALAEAVREHLRAAKLVPADHPLWAERPYKVFVYTPEQVRHRIGYIEGNPVKEGLPRQTWTFVKPYDGWPLHKRDAGQ
jgi:REP element-mobilizing transposase RayT